MNEQSKPTLRPFLLWLVMFYASWAILVFGRGHWLTVVSHWPISLAMAAGSYVAGSTPMGGGTVGFPVLVLLFDFPGSLGRNFGLAVQSIGMVSASIYILSSRKRVAWNLLRPAMVGALIGTPLGAAFIAPVVPDLWVKLVFAVVWASFGMMHLFKLRELIDTHGSGDWAPQWDVPTGLLIGVSGGIVASITGVGIDMILYATMMLLYRIDLKISVPSSVLIMAFTSVIGIATNLLLREIDPTSYAIDPEVFANWIAAAPIVALGAPIGAVVVDRISRAPTLIIVSILCIVQFVWTMIHEHVTGGAFWGAMAGLIAMNGVFHLLYKRGRRNQK